MSLAEQDYQNKSGGQKWQGKKKFGCWIMPFMWKERTLAADCWADPNNARKRPHWFKGNAIAVAQTSSRKSEELLLINMSWGKYADQFEDKDDFDYEKSTIELKKDEHMLRIAVANKLETLATKHVSDNVSILEDPDIFVIGPIQPDERYKVALSIGYKMTEDEDKIVYEKYSKQIGFDIKIKSPDRILLEARMTRTNIGGANT